jgi:methionyl-tRNA formyltransferase
MRIVFMGSPLFTVPVLRFLKLNGQEIAAVYTRPDKPAGRGREPAAPPIKEAALELGLPVVQVNGFKSPEALRQLADFQPQAIVVAAYGLILPQSVLDSAPLGCLNIHPSLLPRYRGPSPVISTLLAGERWAGVSLMQLDAGMDSGPLISQAQIAILDQDDAVTLTAKLFEIGARMVLEALAGGFNGKRPAEPQNSALATFTREIEKEDGRINWQNSADQIWRQVRAYQPWPQAYTLWQGRQIKILRASPLPGSPSGEPGRVTRLGGGRPLAVGTGQGLLAVEMLQIEGKRAMTADEFLRGQRDFEGAQLE